MKDGPVRFVARVLPVFALAGGVVAQTWRAITPPLRWRTTVCGLPGAHLMMCGGWGPQGAMGDTWLFDGTNWTARPAVAPPGLTRQMHEMVWDLGRNRAVLFGGRLTDTQGTALDDLWEHDGSSWTRIPLAVRPPARTNHMLVYDAYRARTVLFGGVSAATVELGDTWEYDGATWTQIQTPGPSPRLGMAAAFDLVRGVTVMFGGSTLSSSRSTETWEYDAAGWRLIRVAASPPAGAGMCFDLVHNRIVLCGAFAGLDGTMAQAWAYDGRTWSMISIPLGPGAPSPPLTARVIYDWATGAPAVWDGCYLWHLSGYLWLPTEIVSPGVMPRSSAPFDAVRGVMVAYAKGRTYEYSARRWRSVAASPASPTSDEHDLVYDSARGRVVMFGGYPPLTNDTWEYDGSGWTLQSPATRPPARSSFRMAFDSRRRRVVMFGGEQPFPYYPGPSWLSDTWEYDGTNWRAASVTTRPAARQGHSLVYDPSRDRCVLFGGGIIGSIFGDTWEYDGDWHQRSPAVSPPPRAQHGSVYDPVRGRMLIHGGIDPGNNYLADTWSYDGNSWAMVATTPAPQVPQSLDVTLAVDPRTGFVTAYDYATWELVEAPVPTATRYGRGCSNGGAVVPGLDAGPGSLPALGGTFTVQFSSLPSGGSLLYLAFGVGLAQWCGAALPIPLDLLGLPQCLLWIPPDDGGFLPASGSAASVTLPVPYDPSLAAVLVGMQAAVFDATAPSGIGALTNALALRLW